MGRTTVYSAQRAPRFPPRVQGPCRLRGLLAPQVATYRAKITGHLSGENAWLPIPKIPGYLTANGDIRSRLGLDDHRTTPPPDLPSSTVLRKGSLALRRSDDEICPKHFLH